MAHRGPPTARGAAARGPRKAALRPEATRSPGAPAGRQGRGGSRENQATTEAAATDAQQARAGPRAQPKARPPRRKSAAKGRATGAGRGAPGPEAAKRGRSGPPRGHALHKAQARATQGRPNREPEAQTRAGPQADGASERPRSAKARTRAERESGGQARQARPRRGPKRPEGAKRRTGAPKAGRGPRAGADAATRSGASAGRGERKKARSASGPETTEGLGPLAADCGGGPAGTGGAMCPGPRPGSIRTEMWYTFRVGLCPVCRANRDGDLMARRAIKIRNFRGSAILDTRTLFRHCSEMTWTECQNQLRN